LLHKYLRRAITREDLRWTSSSEGGNFVASVEVPPLSIPAVKGQSSSTKKAAEQSAAKEAVQRLLARGDILTEKPPKPPQAKNASPRAQEDVVPTAQAITLAVCAMATNHG